MRFVGPVAVLLFAAVALAADPPATPTAIATITVAECEAKISAEKSALAQQCNDLIMRETGRRILECEARLNAAKEPASAPARP